MHECIMLTRTIMKLIVDHQPVEFQPDDSVLVAMLRAGLHPTGGGCLCLAGDCSHCLATVDGRGLRTDLSDPRSPWFGGRAQA